jgi:DNA transformation protein
MKALPSYTYFYLRPIPEEAMDDGYTEYIMNDILGHIEGLSGRKMFGGYGIYRGGLMCALIAFETLYFKVDDENRPDYEAADMGPFVFESKRGKSTMSYWQVPEEVMEDRDEIQLWLDKAWEVAKRASDPAVP